MASGTEFPVLRKWLDYIVEVIDSESRLASQTIKHGGNIGDIREFLIKMVLKRIIPSTLGISRGQVYDHRNQFSNEIDIIIHRKDLPVIRHPDGSVSVMVESVVATIEVKSTLDSTRLKEALDNCWSVGTLQSKVVNRDKIVDTYDAKEITVKATGKKDYVVRDDALKNAQFHYHGLPYTYIYGYRSQKTLKTVEGLSNATASWCNKTQKAGKKISLGTVPAFILSGEVSGWKNFDPFSIDKWKDDLSKDDLMRLSLMHFTDEVNAHALFVFHLLFSINRRLPPITDFYGLTPNIEGYLKSMIDSYLPMKIYPLKRLLNGKDKGKTQDWIVDILEDEIE